MKMHVFFVYPSPTWTIGYCPNHVKTPRPKPLLTADYSSILDAWSSHPVERHAYCATYIKVSFAMAELMKITHLDLLPPTIATSISALPMLCSLAKRIASCINTWLGLLTS
jgi:hypothetical protein